MNVKRNVRGYAQAGFAGERLAFSGGQETQVLTLTKKTKLKWMDNHCVSFCFIKATCTLQKLLLLPGILIEDQVAPKSCGHVKGKRVVGREEAVSRIRAAVDAR